MTKERKMTRLRILGIVWTLAGALTGFLGIIVTGLSQDLVGGGAGLLLLILAGLGLAMGAAMWGVHRDWHIRASWALSVLWLIGSILTALSMDFPADRWLAGGLPAAVAVLTAVLALSAWRPRPRGRRSTPDTAEVGEAPR
jgi:uncharacterized membrane protein